MLPAHPMRSRRHHAAWLALFATLMLAAGALTAQPRTPNRKPPSGPFVAFLVSRDTIHWLNVAPFTVRIMMGPGTARMEAAGGMRLEAIAAGDNLYNGIVERPETGTFLLRASAAIKGVIATDEKVLAVDRPRLRGERFKDGQLVRTGIDNWPALTATVGEVYDPSTHFYTPGIPDEDYQTIVAIKGEEVLNQEGTAFTPHDVHQQSPLMITPGLHPEDIATSVYWKPGGTQEISHWVLLVSNQEKSSAPPVIPLDTKRMTIEAPRAATPARMPATFVLSFNAKTPACSTPPLDLSWMLSPGDTAIAANAECHDCATYSLQPQLTRLPNGRYRLTLTAADYDLLEEKRSELGDRPLELTLTLRGRRDIRTHTMLLYVALPESP